MALLETSEVRPNELDVAVHEWLRSSYAQTMELAHAQISEDKKKNPFTKTGSSGAMFDSAEGSLECPRSGAEGSGSGKSPVAQRSRKRKDGVDKWTVRVATPRMGNTDIPPDDGFTWRKYGQKEILGSMFPRGYYRCTHKIFYGCDAKKQVQRLDEDPNTFEVTYYGNHTCHFSQTAPSRSPLSTAASTSIIRQQESFPENLSPPPPPAPTCLPLHRWLSMDMGGVSKEKDTFEELHLQTHRDFNQMGESGNITSTSTARPSTSRGAKGVEFPVVDLADAMFNSGGSSNSLDSIFPSPMQDN
ncbi:Wrky transcription factor protein [Thalictrum thalictroides]|uniref:Wrky transcription factor protein n=1 Tax=Thalictrum thalictroides TaxID=46969 RepID=A0A7J6UTX5_THATH|nr:Wrky transcription factor protein [Thalictrum thalictroides]